MHKRNKKAVNAFGAKLVHGQAIDSQNSPWLGFGKNHHLSNDIYVTPHKDYIKIVKILKLLNGSPKITKLWVSLFFRLILSSSYEFQIKKI
jgi:hypothetical protein